MEQVSLLLNNMNKKELDFILQEGEGLKIEFKESLSNVDKEMVAFANAEGGRIFLGVSDKNKVKGIKLTNRLKSEVQDIANNCDPPVTIKLENTPGILIIHISEGRSKPYRCSSGFYMRQGPNSQKMKTSDIKKMVLSQSKIRFDEKTDKNFDFSDFDKDAFVHYLRRAGIDYRGDEKYALFNMGVSKGSKLNNAGILFFAKNPKKYFINAYITCARYKGTEKVKVIDRKDIEENLIVQVEDSVKFIERNTRLEYEIEGLYRKEIPEYPIEAIREAVLNAVMHRDYFETGANVQIDIFDDRIVITNIGGLIKPLTKEKLGKIAVRRNPLIADLFHRAGLVEKMGTGIRRIRDVCRKHGKIAFSVETNGYFIATFKFKGLILPVGEKVGEKVGERLTDNQMRIIDELKKDKFVSAEGLSGKVGISKRKIEENISKLKKKGLLKRVGSARTGYWEVK